MTISPLADLPDAIQTLAKWFYEEWHAFDGRSIEFIATQLSENLNPDSIPIIFVAHRNSELLGSVSLDLSDLPPFDYLSPWPASLLCSCPLSRRGRRTCPCPASPALCHVTRNWSSLPLDAWFHSTLRALRLGRIYIRDLRLSTNQTHVSCTSRMNQAPNE